MLIWCETGVGGGGGGKSCLLVTIKREKNRVENILMKSHCHTTEEVVESEHHILANSTVISSTVHLLVFLTDQHFAECDC